MRRVRVLKIWGRLVDCLHEIRDFLFRCMNDDVTYSLSDTPFHVMTTWIAYLKLLLTVACNPQTFDIFL